MDVIIRPATMDDMSKVQELNLILFKKEKEEYDPALDLDWVSGDGGIKYYSEKISEDDGCVLVAVVDDKIIGYICGGLAKAGSYGRLPTIIVAEIHTFFILDEFRSGGIGKKLYNGFLDWSKTKNADKIRLDVHPQNELAIKFYKNNNFKEYCVALEADL